MRIAFVVALLVSCADRSLEMAAPPSGASWTPVGGAIAPVDFAAVSDLGGPADLADGCASLDEKQCLASEHCHPTYKDSGLCDCSTPLCCPVFDRCWARKHANCDGPGCGADPPVCTPLRLAYGASCYEGCVKPEECAGVCASDEDCGVGLKCCKPGPGGPDRCVLAVGACPPLP